MAVLAVYALAHGVRRGEAADGGIVPLLRRGLQKAQHLPQLLPVGDPRQHRHDAGLIQGILQALIRGQRRPEGGLLGIQQLAAAEGLHHGDAHALPLAAGVKLLPLTGFRRR